MRCLRKCGDGQGAQRNLADFGRQRQLEAAFGQRPHQSADTHSGLRANRVFAELQNFVERAHVDRGSAVAAHAACLRIIRADGANRRRVGLGLAQDGRYVFDILWLQHDPRPSI